MGVGAVGNDNLNRMIQFVIDQNRADKVPGHLVRHTFRNINDNEQIQGIVFPVYIPRHLFHHGFEIDLVVRNKRKVMTNARPGSSSDWYQKKGDFS